MLLAIDSATRVLSLALYDGQQIVAELTWNTTNRHTVELSPAIQDLLARANVAVTQLTALAVSQGPGSFNGLRIGFGVAKGLSMALNLPMVAIPTLDIVAAAQPPFDGLLIAVLQAGRGRICAGSYRWQKSQNSAGWISQDDLRIVSWDQVLDSIATPTLICGEIDTAGRDAITQSVNPGSKPIQIGTSSSNLRRAGTLAELAWRRWHDGQTDDPVTVAPLYLHQPGVPHP